VPAAGLALALGTTEGVVADGAAADADVLVDGAADGDAEPAQAPARRAATAATSS
jgi:hypothetical protein